MSWTEKIDNKKYITGTVVNLLFGIYVGWPGLASTIWMVITILSISFNHYYTIKVFAQLVQSRINQNTVSKKKLGLYLVLKTLSLFAAFLCLLIFNRDKVPQGLVLYIFQLIILFLSIKNIGQLFKKGPSL